MFRPLELYIGLRYTRAKRRNHFISFISLISIMGVGLGVAALITVLSVMNGFEGELRGRLLSMSAHGSVAASGGITPDWQRVVEEVGAEPGVEQQAHDFYTTALRGDGERGLAPVIAVAQLMALGGEELGGVFVAGQDRQHQRGLAPVIDERERLLGRAQPFDHLGGRVVVSPYLRAVGAFYDSSSTSGRQEFGSYVVPALRIEGAIDTGAGTSALLALDLNNLTDERYEMPWQFRDPGFNAFASATLRLPSASRSACYWPPRPRERPGICPRRFAPDCPGDPASDRRRRPKRSEAPPRRRPLRLLGDCRPPRTAACQRW